MESDLESVARRVAADVLRLGPDDSVDIEAAEHTLALAREIVKQARRQGADTLLTLDSDDIWYDALFNLPLEWLKEPSRLQQAVRGIATASIYLGGLADPTRMRDIPSERWQANSEGARATYEPFEESPIPSVYLQIAQVTPARARAYGFDYERWHSSVMAAMDVDPKELRKRGEALVKRLSGARHGRVTAPGGTAFEFEFHGSEAAVFTGEVRPAEGSKASYFTSLPSGSVSIALKRGSGDGTVVASAPIPQMGDLIEGLTWEFEGGRLVRVDASRHLDFFEVIWTEDKRKKGADQLGFLTVGLNPHAELGFLQDEIAEGVVSIGIGDNESLGGDNDCGYGFSIPLRDATVEVDGRKLAEGGRLSI